MVSFTKSEKEKLKKILAKSKDKQAKEIITKPCVLPHTKVCGLFGF